MPKIDTREMAAVFAGGCAGAVARVALADHYTHGVSSWPWATFLANIAGAALLGFVITHLHENSPTRSYLTPLLGAGFCGALTTFSTFQLELVRMVDAGCGGLAIAYAVVSITAGLLAVAVTTSAVRHRRAA